MSIEIKGITKRFNSFTALDNLSLTVSTGELVALLGPSGSGKTTLLRIISGLEVPDSGTVTFNGSEERRMGDQQVGFVFQHYALFRHMTVFENVAFGLRVRPKKLRPSRDEIKKKVSDLLRLVQLENAADRYPAQLSGGQRQRIALSRALAVEPKVLLLDEPFGALDAKVRQELRRWLRRLHDELNVTSVFVTHDQDEALEVSDRVVVMNEGRIEQAGTPEEVYDMPGTPFVYQFIGNVNMFHGRVVGGKTKIGGVEIYSPGITRAADSDVVGYIRPHEIEIELERIGGAGIPAAIDFINAVGPVVRIELKRLDTGEFVEAHLTRQRFSELGLKRGSEVYINIGSMRLFADDYAI